MKSLGKFKLTLIFFVGVFQLFAQEFEVHHISTKDGLPQRTIRSIVKDKYGFMWIATWNGLCRYDGYEFKVYQNTPNDSTSIANSRIHHIYKEPDGTLWITTFNSFVCRYNYDTDNFTRFKIHELPQAIRDSTYRSNNVLNIERNRLRLEDQLGSFEYSENKEHVVFLPLSPTVADWSDNHINCIYYDDQDLLWLGTTKGGINKINLRPKRFEHLVIPRTNERGKPNAVRALWSDSSGVWIGTQEDGLFYIDADKKKPIRFQKKLTSQNIRALLRDQKGRLWIGSQSGLDCYDPESDRLISVFGKNNTSKYERFYAIAEDPFDQSLWFGTYNAILRYDVETAHFEEIDLADYFSRSSAGCLYFDDQSNLWIGTEYTGLLRLRRNSKTAEWHVIEHYEGDGAAAILPDERVYSVVQDQEGKMWVGTANGLCRLDPTNNEVIWLGRKEGLSDAFITKVLFDGHQHIWVGHKSGVSSISIQDLSIQNYTIDEGYENYEAIEGSGYIDTRLDRLFFGGMGGLLSFSPYQEEEATYIPPVVLTNLVVQNQKVDVGEKVNGDSILLKPLYLTNEITLNQRNNSFSIEFSSLDFVNPRDILYTYKLEGIDEGWVPADATSRVAMYRNLPVGKYYFSVRAANHSGVWSGQSKTLTVHILPPWWRTWWAYGGYLLLVAGALYFIVQYFKTKIMYREQLLLEKVKVEKTQELELLKTNFFTQVSHELRTPLTLLIDPLYTLITEKLPESKRKTYYKLMYRNANRLLLLVNQLLDLRKMEVVPLQLKGTRQEVVAVIRNVVASFEFQAQQHGVILEVHSNRDQFEFVFDCDALEKIVFNLLSNALKFTPAGGIISVDVEYGYRGGIVLSVANSGSFIEEKDLKKIFDPFYQIIQENDKHIGSGIGLSVVRELALQHGGYVEVQSEKDAMTIFNIHLAALSGTEEKEIADAVEIDGDSGYSEKGMEMVLVVEDDSEIRAYLATVLNDKGYQVEVATTGEEGWEKAIETIPDLIVSDVMMPGRDGLELCHNLKSDRRTSHIPVLLLTAKREESDRVKGYETGADAYISKPFRSRVFLSRVDNLISNRKKLRTLFNRESSFDLRKITTNELDRLFLDKAKTLIEQNMSNHTFDVEWLARELMLSRTQLYRKLKALTNQSVYEFITTIRLNKAAEFLMEGVLSVSEIAYAVGYADSTSFGRAFQKQFGKRPTQYSKK